MHKLDRGHPVAPSDAENLPRGPLFQVHNLLNRNRRLFHTVFVAIFRRARIRLISWAGLAADNNFSLKRSGLESYVWHRSNCLRVCWRGDFLCF